MSITSEQIKFYKSAEVSNAPSNGGYSSRTAEIVSSVLNNLFPDVRSTERSTGLTRYRKGFLKNLSSEGLTLYDTLVWLRTQSPGADMYHMLATTHASIQSDVSAGFHNWAGAGVLNESVPLGALPGTLKVEMEAQQGIFNGATLMLESGEIYRSLQVVGEPTWYGNVAWCAVSGEASTSSFGAQNTTVGVVVDLGDVRCDLSNWAETSAAGTYNESAYPALLFNTGTVDDDWTLTFSSSTAFTVSGARTGSVGSGTIASDFRPVNPNGGYYFSLDRRGWGGTWAAGNTLRFSTSEASGAFWIRQTVPPAAAPQKNNNVTVAWRGESV